MPARPGNVPPAPTNIPPHRLREIRELGVAADRARGPFVDPGVLSRCTGVLGRRGERWAAAILGRNLSRRSLAVPGKPWLSNGEPDALIMADQEEDAYTVEAIAAAEPDELAWMTPERRARYEEVRAEMRAEREEEALEARERAQKALTITDPSGHPMLPAEVAVSQSGDEWTVHLIFAAPVVTRLRFESPGAARAVAWAIIAALPGVEYDLRALPEEG
jgi:hypothetical protein